MKNKKLLTGAISLALVAVVSVGATLAYFTDKTETAQNVFSAGKVSLSLIDKSEPEEGQVGGEPYEKDGITGIQYDNIMPGDVLSKIVGLNTAVDSQDAYVAIRVTVNDVVAPNANTVLPEEITAQISDIIASQVDGDLWASKDLGNGDVVYYFKTVVPADTKNLILFSAIPLPGSEWNNEYAELSFDVDVQAAAIQAANTDLDLFMGMDWGDIVELAD